MRVTTDLDLKTFKAWSGAIDTQKRIVNEGKADDFDSLIEELYPDGIDETHLNDLLWFEEDWIFEQLGIDTNDEEE